ncbi:hypothetical protein HPB47_008883 [Ixodes persulcatus]|uniref:Uncharacterized protein n=1 Tax=Ixodes persulcatus TaxID=34615 RepID=A0AC60P3I3_IXOPE|nr:hypothetical protein HPB47_008883 [Ixodes persulcatus]
MAAVSSSVSPSKAPVLPSPARFQTTFAKTSFGKEARQVVLNVYYKLRCESPNESYKAIVQRTSELTRVGYSTIFRWKKLVQSSPDGTPLVPSPKRKRKRSAPPTPSLLDSFDRGTLRLIVHDFFRRNECPTLSKFPKISRTTLWRALVDLGFTFVKRNRDSLLMERTDLVLWPCGAIARAAEPRILGSIPTPARFDLDEHRTGVQSCITTTWCTLKDPRLAVVLHWLNYSPTAERLVVR